MRPDDLSALTVHAAFFRSLCRESAVPALADTGSVFLGIPDHIRVQLGLETLQEREVVLADGSCFRVPYVGPVVECPLSDLIPEFNFAMPRAVNGR